MFSCVFPASAQVFINEVSSANFSVISDEDNDFSDWIELYNSGNDTVNLLNYALIRTEDKTKNWKFPDLAFYPHSFLTIFASGKGRKNYFDHWESAIKYNDVWRYQPGTSAPDTSWREINFVDSVWLQGKGGIGFGDGDDSTVISPVSSLFMRKSFQISDTSKIALALLSIDYDDGFVAWLNGIEIARSNLGISGDSPEFNTLAPESHEAKIYQAGFSEKFFIDKQKLSSALLLGANILALEVHNADTVSSGDLSVIADFNLAISDNQVTLQKIASPLTGLHTDYKLSSGGQTLTLTDSVGNIIDAKAIGALQPNHSRGRNPDGSNNWCLFSNPSPGVSNGSPVCVNTYGDIPVFSLPAGFYTGSQLVSISSSDTIRFTTDGSIPTSQSTIYSGPISVDSTMVLRARSFNVSAFLPGETITNTYFINENISIPVISLSTDSENLWNWNNGIYVKGPDAGAAIPFFGANFWKDWEKQGHAEYFDSTGKPGFELEAGLKIFGNFTRAFPQKGFRISARDCFGTSQVNYKIFSGRDFSSFKNFNIRNAGNDWNIVHFRDGLLHKAVKSNHLDIMEYEPCVAFLNGKYWGVYELRERQDKYFFSNNHGADPDKIDLLEYNGDVIEGSNKNFISMADFISTSDMTVKANYDSAAGMMDMDNFCDYFIIETYVNNRDWLISNQFGAGVNNIKFWRTNNPIGKWRYILWDVDVTLGLYGLSNDNSLLSTINAANPHSEMLKSLLQNSNFRSYFINRYADLMNTIFVPANLGGLAFKMRDKIAPEMARHFLKWGNTFPNSIGVGTSYNPATWNNAINNFLMFFINYRPGYSRGFIKTQFALNKQTSIGLNVSPKGAGQIQISTIIPDSLPWTGIYFDGNPVTITATAKSGFRFSHWQSSKIILVSNPDSSITINPSADDTLVAYFDTIINKDTILPVEPISEVSFDVYPNPLSNSFFIRFALPADAPVSLKLYNMLGKEVAEIISPDHTEKAGRYTINPFINSFPLSDGVYFFRFITEGYSATIKRIKINDEN